MTTPPSPGQSRSDAAFFGQMSRRFFSVYTLAPAFTLAVSLALVYFQPSSVPTVSTRPESPTQIKRRLPEPPDKFALPKSEGDATSSSTRPMIKGRS
jgi:hypothetical protein